MKDWLTENASTIFNTLCVIQVGVTGFFATWILSKPSRVEIDNRFDAVNLSISTLQTEVVKSNQLHYETSKMLGEIKAMLIALKESSIKEDENLKELILTRLNKGDK